LRFSVSGKFVSEIESRQEYSSSTEDLGGRNMRLIHIQTDKTEKNWQ
jgi:hypothetical protein